ncbi:MAG: SDR family oxidoreductase [Spirochaetes bacterium]|nr:SDR family oxidoreductase [Spirochaetota bacterium]
MPNTVLITGSSTGIGKETALYFYKKGWNVVATMRNPDKRKTELHETKMDIVHLDVLEINSIKKAIRYTLDKFGKIDVFVNNAGYAVRGAFELSTREQIEKQYNTNVLGLMDAVREIIPIFRKQKHGIIINVASIGGRITVPFYSIYNSTKWAIEGFSEGLHYELKPFNIKVKIIEPGLIKTDFYDRSMVNIQNEEIDVYNKYFEKSLKKTMAMEPSASHPSLIAKIIYKAATDNRGKLRYSKGKNSWLVLFLRKILPDTLFFKIIKAST